MALLSICVTQINKYSFKVFDTTLQETYDTAGVDLSTVTAAKLTFKNLYDNSTYEVDILDKWSYLLDDGTLINVMDFPNMKMGDYSYFPDYMYEITVTYTYNSVSYTSVKTIGFRSIITGIINQQMQQSDWISQLKEECCSGKSATTRRKYNYLDLLSIASANCLISHYTELLLSLYKLTGTTHEYN